jgi:hypothetical protein
MIRYVTPDGNFSDGYAYSLQMLRNNKMNKALQEMNNPPVNPFAAVQDISPAAAAQHYQQMRGNSKMAAQQWLHNYNPSLAAQLLGKG